MNDFSIINLPVFTDDNGSLVPIELKEYISFEPKRVYYLLNANGTRGGHSHRTEEEFFVCQKGTMKLKLHDGNEWHEIKMEEPGQAIYIPNMVWHEFTDFSPDAILLAVSSTNYDQSDYIRDLDQFINEKNA